MLIIPANNSSTGLFLNLNDNQGVGLLFETEGDTLAQTFKSEHGNYSDGFRKAFHHSCKYPKAPPISKSEIHGKILNTNDLP